MRVKHATGSKKNAEIQPIHKRKRTPTWRLVTRVIGRIIAKSLLYSLASWSFAIIAGEIIAWRTPTIGLSLATEEAIVAMTTPVALLAAIVATLVWTTVALRQALRVAVKRAQGALAELIFAVFTTSHRKRSKDNDPPILLV